MIGNKIKIEWARCEYPGYPDARKALGLAADAAIEFVLAVPCLYQGWECDPWAFVVRDEKMNRYLLQSNHGRWQKGTPEDLATLVKKYSEASQIAVRGFIELTEGKQAELAKLKEGKVRGKTQGN